MLPLRNSVLAKPIFFGNLWLVLPCEGKHVVVAIDADHFSCLANNLRSDVTDLAAAAAEVEHRLAGVDMLRRVAAAVVALDDFFGDDFEVLRIVIDRATKGRLGRLGRGAVAFSHRLFDIKRLRFLSRVAIEIQFHQITLFIRHAKTPCLLERPENQKVILPVVRTGVCAFFHPNTP